MEIQIYSPIYFRGKDGDKYTVYTLSTLKSLFCFQKFQLYRSIQYTMCYGTTNALVCNKTLIQMSHIKTLKITPACFDHQLIIIRELFDPT
jgi:hypothetical protein